MSGIIIYDDFLCLTGNAERAEKTVVTRFLKRVTSIKDKSTKTCHTLADMVTAHTMRRTAITNMLSLGMSENVVRKISGHTPGSKEFFRYVEYAQSVLDEETQRYHERMKELNEQKD
ncbi:MAG: hypothetical protein LBN27_03670 [Prevotellaceae bacterium]|jgi:intergrase/recombinase|nr:hypothetical protein [Prevotellaceae bacterium]